MFPFCGFIPCGVQAHSALRGHSGECSGPLCGARDQIRVRHKQVPRNTSPAQDSPLYLPLSLPQNLSQQKCCVAVSQISEMGWGICRLKMRGAPSFGRGQTRVQESPFGGSDRKHGRVGDRHPHSWAVEDPPPPSKTNTQRTRWPHETQHRRCWDRLAPWSCLGSR